MKHFEIPYELEDFFSKAFDAIDSGRPFDLICNGSDIDSLRRCVELFVEYDRTRPRGLIKYKMLFSLALVGFRRTALLAVCNRALLKSWDLRVSNNKNSVAYFEPPPRIDRVES